MLQPPPRLLPLLLALLLSLAARPHAAEPKLQGTIVPEPATGALLALGLAALAAHRRPPKFA